jgi:hypothetical protein
MITPCVAPEMQLFAEIPVPGFRHADCAVRHREATARGGRSASPTAGRRDHRLPPGRSTSLRSRSGVLPSSAPRLARSDDVPRPPCPQCPERTRGPHCPEFVRESTLAGVNEQDPGASEASYLFDTRAGARAPWLVRSHALLIAVAMGQRSRAVYRLLRAVLRVAVCLSAARLKFDQPVSSLIRHGPHRARHLVVVPVGTCADRGERQLPVQLRPRAD